MKPTGRFLGQLSLQKSREYLISSIILGSILFNTVLDIDVSHLYNSSYHPEIDKELFRFI